MRLRCFHCKGIFEAELPYVCTEHLFVVRLCSDQCLKAHQQEHENGGRVG
jgi:hypothetical protein